MSEKRFEVDVDHLLLVWDTEKNKRLEIEDIVDLLNEQQDQIHRDELSIKVMFTNMEKLEKENEQLKQKLENKNLYEFKMDHDQTREQYDQFILSLSKDDTRSSDINHTKFPDDIILQGNMNGLIQVIDNLIANAIYVYKSQGKTDQVIDLSANYLKTKNSIEIRIKDYGPGLPQEVQDKLFKEMVTTKGKEGTGLGLFMSASNIKAQFSGRMDYETKAGKGTTFIITLPVPNVVNA